MKAPYSTAVRDCPLAEGTSMTVHRRIAAPLARRVDAREDDIVTPLLQTPRKPLIDRRPPPSPPSADDDARMPGEHPPEHVVDAATYAQADDRVDARGRGHCPIPVGDRGRFARVGRRREARQDVRHEQHDARMRRPGQTLRLGQRAARSFFICREDLQGIVNCFHESTIETRA